MHLISRLSTSAIICFLIAALSACGGKEKKTPAYNLNQNQDPEIASLSEQIGLNPQDDSLLFRRAQVYYNLNAFDEALVDVGAALKLDSMQPAYYHLMADIYLDYARPNDSRRAIGALETALRKFPDRIPTLLKISEFNLIVRQHTAALKALDRVLRQNPQNAEAYFMTGRIALDMGDTTRAEKSLRKSVQLDAGNADAWVFLGRLATIRRDKAAVQYFDNALRIDTANSEIMEFKAIYYVQTGQYNQAFELYRKIVTNHPDYTTAYFDMGVMYLNLDSLGKAYDHFDIAIKTDPLFVRGYYYRGLASESMGNLDAALADYTQASKMSPNYLDAKEARDRLEVKLGK